jgi:hypothetical protein
MCNGGIQLLRLAIRTKRYYEVVTKSTESIENMQATSQNQQEIIFYRRKLINGS